MWAYLVTLSVLGGLVLYFGFAGALYYAFYVRRRDQPEAWKIQPKRFLSQKVHRWAMLIAASNLMFGGLLSGSFAYYVLTGGPVALYLQVDDYGWAYTVFSTVVGFVLVEAGAYYVHRLFHNRWLFRKFHRWHHRCVAPTPFTATTIHPVELLFFQASAFLPAIVFPMWAGSFIAILVYVLLFNIMDHSGIEIRHSFPWQSSSRYHDDHHVHFHCNYGQNLMIFDRLHGTLRRQKRRYGVTVFGGKGTPAGEEHDGPPPFVDYS